MRIVAADIAEELITPGPWPGVRRHALRRLLVADVIGLVVAAFLGPLIVSALLQQPGQRRQPQRNVYLFDLAMIPLFIGVFALYGLYRGATRRISTSVFSDLRNIVHALMISGFLYAVVAYVAKQDFGTRVADRGQDRRHVPGGRGHRSAGPGRWPSVCSVGPRWARSRSSWWGPASWPRRWPATCGPTPASTSSGSSTTTRWGGAT